MNDNQLGSLFIQSLARNDIQALTMSLLLFKILRIKDSS